MAKKKLNQKQLQTAIIAVGLIALLGVGGYFAYTNLILQSEAGGFATTADYIYIKINVEGNTAVLELSEDELADVTVTPYTCDITDLTDEEIADLVYADFTAGTAKTSVESDDKLDLEDDAITIFLIEHADCWDSWLTSYTPGMINEVNLVNASADANIQHFARDGSTTTLNETDIEEWSFMIFAETTDTDYVQGYPGQSYDFENDCWNRTGVRVLYNTTAKGSWSTIKTAGWIKEVSGNYTYFWQNEPLLYANPLKLDVDFLTASLQVDFNVTSAEVVWGSLEGEVTAI